MFLKKKLLHKLFNRINTFQKFMKNIFKKYSYFDIPITCEVNIA